MSTPSGPVLEGTAVYRILEQRIHICSVTAVGSPTSSLMRPSCKSPWPESMRSSYIDGAQWSLEVGERAHVDGATGGCPRSPDRLHASLTFLVIRWRTHKDYHGNQTATVFHPVAAQALKINTTIQTSLL